VLLISAGRAKRSILAEKEDAPIEIDVFSETFSCQETKFNEKE
jgi:hypothetical protein